MTTRRGRATLPLHWSPHDVEAVISAAMQAIERLLRRSSLRAHVAFVSLSLVAVGCAPGEGPGGPSSTNGDHSGGDCAEVPGLDAVTCAEVRALALPDALPAARGNAYADDEDAAALGLGVFFDARFSANEEVRCATCHEPEAYFADARPTSDGGLGALHRNSPTTLNAAGQRWSFWDGRADSLWSQPLLAFEANEEMGTTRLEVAHLVRRHYGDLYERVFGPLPELDDAERFPASGKPGDDAWERMSEDDRFAIDRVFANVGKALEAYLRRSTTGRSRVDDFLYGDEDALSQREREGLRVFATSGCLSCHAGPRYSDERFHNLGVPDAEGSPADEGRAAGARLLAESTFHLGGPHADDPPADARTPEELLAEAADPSALGAFLTPSLRNLVYTAPYGHNGAFETLEDVIEHHLAGGADGGFLGEVDPRLEPMTLSDDELDALVEFLVALEGELPPPPWADWPDR